MILNQIYEKSSLLDLIKLQIEKGYNFTKEANSETPDNKWIVFENHKIKIQSSTETNVVSRNKPFNLETIVFAYECYKDGVDEKQYILKCNKEKIGCVMKIYKELNDFLCSEYQEESGFISNAEVKISTLLKEGKALLLSGVEADSGKKRLNETYDYYQEYVVSMNDQNSLWLHPDFKFTQLVNILKGQDREDKVSKTFYFIDRILKRKLEPIIVIPTEAIGLHSLTGAYAESFFGQGKYEHRPLKNRGSSFHLQFDRVIRGNKITFHVIDNLSELDRKTMGRNFRFDQVVAVFLSGPKYQLKHWPMYPDFKKLFTYVRAYFLNLTLRDITTEFKPYNVQFIPLSRDIRHNDESTINEYFWKDLENFLYSREIREL